VSFSIFFSAVKKIFNCLKLNFIVASCWAVHEATWYIYTYIYYIYIYMYIYIYKTKPPMLDAIINKWKKNKKKSICTCLSFLILFKKFDFSFSSFFSLYYCAEQKKWIFFSIYDTTPFETFWIMMNGTETSE